MSEAGGNRNVLAVSELNEILRGLIEDSLPALWVQGEISNLSKPASGHWYFTLKDAQAQIRCAMFKKQNFYVRPQPRDGDAVLVRARAGVYPARGELQLIVEHLEPAGTGALLRAFEELKQRLAAEGLFDAARKRALPPAPRRIGLVTSGSGAALHDVLHALARRWPLAEVLLYPVPVQGAEAPPAIVRALEELPRRAGVGGVDLILLVRGGGSIEDLWAFNDERVARAIHACAVPVVSGVGHEVDTTIADFAADLRAATPTAAAELATPDVAERRVRVADLGDALVEAIESLLAAPGEQLRRQGERLQQLHPGRRLHERAQRLDELDDRLRRAARSAAQVRAGRTADLGSRLLRASPLARVTMQRGMLERLHERLIAAKRIADTARSTRLHRLEALLGSLNPQSVLERGYAVVRDASGKVLRDPAPLRSGDRLTIRLVQGEIGARVRRDDETGEQGALF